MRPIQLIVSAFGPYAEETVIPMDKLGEQGLYLITGDTGAGKTMIFDAICFALFGEASGGNREASMFRSKYARPEISTYVELTFLHRGSEYRIRRNPEYLRPAKRGEGLKKETPNAELYLPDGKVITKVRDVNQAVVELLGMSREQFSQISMLAQGDFLQLLFADTRQRQEIFRELFQTGKYQKLQNRIEEERKNVYVACSEAKRSTMQYISGIAVDSGNLLAEKVQKAKKGDMLTEDVLLLLEQLMEQDRSDRKQLQLKISGQEKSLREHDRRIGQAGEAERTRCALKKAEQDLEGIAPEVQNAKEELENAKEHLRYREDLLKQMNQIDGELPEYQRLQKLQEHELQKKNTQKEKETQLSSSEQNAKAASNTLADWKSEREKLSDAGVKRERLIAESHRLEKMAELLKDLDQALFRWTQLQKEADIWVIHYRKDDAVFKEKNQSYERMDQAYRDGQAGILAESLQEGIPCPVCGSLLHPAPAVKTDEVPSEDQLKKAKEMAESARAKAEESGRKAGEKRRDCENAEEFACSLMKKSLISYGMNIPEEIGNGPLNDMLPLLDEMKADHQQKEKELSRQILEEEQKIRKKNDLEREIPKLEMQIQNLLQSCNGLRVEISGIQAELEADRHQIAELVQKLTFQDLKKAKEKRDQLEQQSKGIFQKHQQAEEHYKLLTEQEAALKGKIGGYKQTLQTAPDIDEAEEKSKRALLEERIKGDRLQDQKAATRIETNEKIYACITEKMTELAAAEKRLQWMTALADTANGKLKGKEKVMLETYIQMTYFDRIIRRANLRLMKMSGAQYELKRLTDPASNRGQSGLELGVIDHYNGSERSVKTLSGGESFMASLSLALGLSDEVQSSAGGIQVDTMFVDEGFGTLDLETLDLAYGALVNLTEGKRLVGIISHVSELKDKIDRQIVVKKEKSGGSRVSVIS